MTRYLLDTNIISNVVKPQPSESLLAWWAEQQDESLFISSLAVAEIRRGILETFDDKAGLVWARLMAQGKAAGRPRSGLGMIVAAIANANDCMVVTDNEKDFAGIQFLNPMRGAD